MAEKESLSLNQLVLADITDIIEPVIVDVETTRQDWFDEKLREALSDLPKPKVGYLVMIPRERGVK